MRRIIPTIVIRVFLPGRKLRPVFGFSGFPGLSDLPGFLGSSGAVGIDRGLSGVGERSFEEKILGKKDFAGAFLGLTGRAEFAGTDSGAWEISDGGRAGPENSISSDWAVSKACRTGSDRIRMAGVSSETAV